MKKLCILFSLVLSLVLVSSVHADLGPKPEVNILVKYNGQPIEDSILGLMLECYGGYITNVGKGSDFEFECSLFDYSKEECEKRFCEWGIRDERYGGHNESYCISKLTSILNSLNDCWKPASSAWGGCGNNFHNLNKSTCNFGYSPPKNFKLAIYYPKIDKLFITSQTSRTNFYSSFEVDLHADGTSSIKETTSIFETSTFMSFFVAFILTLIIELFFGYVYINTKKLKKNSILLFILLANIISVPIVWFVFPLLTASLISAILIGEIFAIFFEAFIFYKFDEKDFSSYRKAVELSIILNATSFLLGGFIFVFIWILFGLPLLYFLGYPL